MPQALDLAIFKALYGFGTGSLFSRVLSVFFATYLIFASLLIAFAVLVFAWQDRAASVQLLAVYLRAGAAAGLAALGNLGISLAFFRPRPIAELGVPSLIGTPLTLKSFPSDHASIAFAIATTLALAWPRGALLWFGIAGLIALGRVMAGVHYPWDVVAGAAVGAAWAFFVMVVDARAGGSFAETAARSIRDLLTPRP